MPASASLQIGRAPAHLYVFRNLLPSITVLQSFALDPELELRDEFPKLPDMVDFVELRLP
jgi:hypothetical protein